MTSLAKREVFGPWVQTSKDIKHVGYIWVFVKKLNEHSKITRYNMRLVSQGFSKKHGTDFEDTYSLVIDAIMFQLLLT